MVSEFAGKIAAAESKEATVDRREMEQIERACAGDAGAVDWLVSRYRVRVVRLAAHVLGDAEEAKDAAQDAFIHAFRSLGGYRNEGRFYTWLYSIVVRVCLDRRRLAWWRRERPLETPDDGFAASGGEIADVELLIVAKSLMAQLSPPMRAMLVLRELEGLEYEEIAQVLRIPVGRVRWRLHAARAQFQELWQRAVEETESV
jgi:RNA polymerase sigma-70 factor (ECF subfamily)